VSEWIDEPTTTAEDQPTTSALTATIDDVTSAAERGR